MIYGHGIHKKPAPGGIRNANATTYDEFDGVDTVTRYVNGVARQTWTTAVVVGNGRRSSLWFLMPNISA